MLRTTVWRRAPKLAGLAVVLAMCLGPARAGGDHREGAVYMMTNEAGGNRLAAFARDGQGLLEFPVFYATGGNGTGKGLGSQGSIAMDGAGDTLYVVNAGSDTISVFDLTRKEPTLIDIVSSGGTFPNSIALSGDLLYVLNAGGSVGGVDAITGFTVAARGKLVPLTNSTRSLSAPSVLPAQVSFSPNNQWLVVTERNGNKIDVFMVLGDGRTAGPTITPSPVTDTFGFVFDSKGYLVVTQANNAVPPGSVSSYRILADGTAEAITNSLVTGTQLAPCWAAITGNGKYVYTVNTASASISAIELDSNTGTLTLLNPVGGGLAGLLPPGTAPTDAAILGNEVLYVNVSGAGQIAAFTIENGGALTELLLSPAGTLPDNASGLVVR
jgi:6-phosphogluconolactonase (cycloisomerase 2 family)